jgi:hypothetical protein
MKLPGETDDKCTPEACKVRKALLAVLSARDVTNVESDILIRKDAGPEGNSLALGNVGLIDVKEARVDGEALKCIEAQAGGIAEAVGDVHGDGEVVVAKPAMVTKKDNRAAAKKAKFKADRAKAANIELAQRLCGAAGSVRSGLGEEATSEGRLGRGSGGEERLGEGGGEGQFQIFFATAIGTSHLRTPCLSLRLRCTPIRFSDRPSTHPLTNPPGCPAPPPTADRRICN